MFKVLRNGLLRYIRYTCPNLWCNSCSKCYGMDCFGTYVTHVQTCDVTRVRSATEWTASVHTLHMSNQWCNSCSKCYGMDCFGTYVTHVQTCDVTRVQSATEWTASVHTLHMSKPVMQLVFNVLRNGRPNAAIMKYCRQWQWRFENASCLDLCKITAKRFRS